MTSEYRETSIFSEKKFTFMIVIFTPENFMKI